jgi:glycosyltransferase involved in cell wall biosynthesis
MRVLVVHNFYRWRGGEDEAAIHLADTLEAHGHSVERFYADSSALTGAPVAQKISAAIQTAYSWSAATRLHNVIRRFRPHLAHIFNIMPLHSPSVYWALSRRRVPIVQSIQNFRFVCPNGFAFTHGEICLRCRHGDVLSAVRLKCLHGDLTQSVLYAGTTGIHRWLGTFAHKAGHLMPVNSMLAKILQEEFPHTPITVLPNCIDTQAFTPRANFDHQFAYLGRLSPEKGVGVLVEAVGHVNGSRLDVVGDGELIGELRQLAARVAPGRVVFHGRIIGRARFEVVRRARALIVPSVWHEPCPMVVLEAMAQGIPVVASRRGGLPDLVSEGDSGLLFEAGRAAELAAHLEKLTSSDALVRHLGEGARRRAEELFDVNVHYRQLQEIYSRALDSSVASGHKS